MKIFRDFNSNVCVFRDILSTILFSVFGLPVFQNYKEENG